MPTESAERSDGRKPDELRPVKFKRKIAPAAAGSALIRMGDTQVICGVSVEEGIPRWLREQGGDGGWITAEYSLLPYATGDRSRRESTAGRVGGRTQEIQRLIGRSLRAVTDLSMLGKRTFWVDCDVLEADGGTRTASITGAYVALRMAVDRLMKQGVLAKDPIREAVAAISVGLVEGRALLDLNYEEDLAADVDMNVVMTASGRFVEMQGTAEKEPFSQRQLTEMMSLAKKGVAELVDLQQEALGEK